MGGFTSPEVCHGSVICFDKHQPGLTSLDVVNPRASNIHYIVTDFRVKVGVAYSYFIAGTWPLHVVLVRGSELPLARLASRTFEHCGSH